MSLRYWDITPYLQEENVKRKPAKFGPIRLAFFLFGFTSQIVGREDMRNINIWVA